MVCFAVAVSVEEVTWNIKYRVSWSKVKGLRGKSPKYLKKIFFKQFVKLPGMGLATSGGTVVTRMEIAEAQMAYYVTI